MVPGFCCFETPWANSGWHRIYIYIHIYPHMPHWWLHLFLTMYFEWWIQTNISIQHYKILSSFLSSVFIIFFFKVRCHQSLIYFNYLTNFLVYNQLLVAIGSSLIFQLVWLASLFWGSLIFIFYDYKCRLRRHALHLCGFWNLNAGPCGQAPLMAEQSPQALSIFLLLRKYSTFCGHSKTNKQTKTNNKEKNKTETKAYKQPKLWLPIVMEIVNIPKTSKIMQYVYQQRFQG